MLVPLPHLVWKSLMNFVIAAFCADEPCPARGPLAQGMSPPPAAEVELEELELEPPVADDVDDEPPEPDGELLSEPQAVREARASASTPAPTVALRPLTPTWIFTGKSLRVIRKVFACAVTVEARQRR